MYYNIKEFGATGDGISKDTNAIQNAIDHCCENGGGRVIVPPGVFLTGTLNLKSNIELYLMQGAKLLGSPDPQDYTGKYNAPYDTGCKAEHVTGMHLIHAWGKENISITGNGIIDGNGTAFFGPEIVACHRYSNWEWRNRWRPGQMVAMLECKSIKIEDVTFQNSTYWTIWPYACEDVVINNIKIRNDWKTPNGDGIDPDCCENVIISNCDISAGDDAIALRANQARSGLKRNLENVVITNCILDTPLGGIRFGPSGEKSKISNVSVSNCVIRNAGKGILFSQWHRPPNWEKGVLIENIRISNIIINAYAPLRMYIDDNCGGPCGFRNIFMNNISAVGTDACVMIGNDDCVFENIYISDFHLCLTKLQEGPGLSIVKQGLGNAFYIKNVKNINMQDITIDVSSPELKGLKNVMVFNTVKKVRLNNLDIIPGKGRNETIMFKNVDEFEKINCEVFNKNFLELKTEK